MAMASPCRMALRTCLDGNGRLQLKPLLRAHISARISLLAHLGRPCVSVAAGEGEQPDEHSNREEDAAADTALVVCGKLAKQRKLQPGLYLVGTPIGNLEDISLRALSVLSHASVVLAEDTRVTKNLMEHFRIRTPLVSYHMHNERAREEEMLTRIRRGEVLALVSDAGMPGISDPGSQLVAAVAQAGLLAVPIPGPSAVLAGLVGSGLPTEDFRFVGFMPPKSNARRQRLAELADSPATLVMYVPPHGLKSTLEDIQGVLGGDRSCCVARELTKFYEEFWRGTVDEALAEFSSRTPRGEVTFILEGKAGGGVLPQDTIEDKVRQLLGEGMSVSEISKKVSKEFPSVGRKKIYQMAMIMRQKTDR